MKILIVDDSPLMRKILKDFLESEGYEVYETGTFSDALSLAEQIQPELIIKDLYMADCEAIESINIFLKKNSRIKIVICTTDTYRDQILEGLKAGAKDFLLKPFDREKVLNVVKRVAVS